MEAAIEQVVKYMADVKTASMADIIKKCDLIEDRDIGAQVMHQLLKSKMVKKEDNLYVYYNKNNITKIVKNHNHVSVRDKYNPDHSALDAVTKRIQSRRSTDNISDDTEDIPKVTETTGIADLFHPVIIPVAGNINGVSTRHCNLYRDTIIGRIAFFLYCTRQQQTVANVCDLLNKKYNVVYPVLQQLVRKGYITVSSGKGKQTKLFAFNFKDFDYPLREKRETDNNIFSATELEKCMNNYSADFKPSEVLDLINSEIEFNLINIEKLNERNLRLEEIKKKYQ